MLPISRDRRELPIGRRRMHSKATTAKIGRGVCDQIHRGYRLARRMIRGGLEEAAQGSGGCGSRSSARSLHALGSTAEIGFVAQGRLFDDAGIDHARWFLSF